MADQVQGQSSSGYFFAGVLVGGLAGAVVSLLMAPQSGKATRVQLQQMGIDLRDDATETAEYMASQVRETGKKVSTDVRETAEKLKRRGQNVVTGQP